jgi:hypothetical protein
VLLVAAAAGLVILVAATVWLWGLRGESGEPSRSEQAGPAARSPAGPEPAMESTLFDPVKHLDGYGDAFIADWNDLYSFEPFEQAKSKPITAAKLAEARDAWARERERVGKERRRLESDPMALHLYRLERRFVTHRFFPKVEYTRSFGSLPFAFFIQKPLKPDPGYEERITAKFVPWLQEMEKLFRETYVEPLKLPRHEAAPCYAFAVLATRGLYDDYARAVEDALLLQSEAHYNTDLRLGVTYEELVPFDQDEARRRSMLHEFIHALQHAYSSGDGTVKPLWFIEGLAQYWTEGRIRNLEDMKKPQLDPGRLKWFVDLLRSGDAALAAPLKDLVSVDSEGYAGIYEEAVKRLGKARRKRHAAELWSEVLDAFYSQSYLFMHFLHQGDGGKRLQGLLRYTREVMGGKSGWAVFLEAFEGEDLTDPFLTFLRESHEQRWPGKLEGQLALESSKVKAAPARGDSVTRAEKAKTPAPSKVEPSSLRIGNEEEEAILGTSISLASKGRLDEAVSRLRAGGQRRTPLAARIRREIERMEEALGLRDEILGSAARSKAVLEVANTRGRVEKFDADRKVIHLSVRGKVQELGVAELTTESLRRAAEAQQALKGSRSWMGAYLLLLSGQPVRTVLDHRYLKGELSSKARELRNDAEDFERLRAFGEAAQILDDLSRRKPPTEDDGAAAADALSRLRTLAERHGGLELVRKRRQGLRSYAEALLDRTFDRTKADCLGVHGKLEKGAQDAIKLVYEFEDAREASDFLPERDYLAEWRREMQQTQGLAGVKKPESSTFAVEDGALSGIGATSCRLILPFAAPFRVRYVASCSGASEEEEQYVFIVGVCDDGRGVGVRCSLQGDMSVLSEQSVQNLEGKIRQIVPGQPYHYEIRHDGEAIELQAGSGTVKLERVERLKRGSLFLWIHANFKVRVTRLEIEAVLDEESLLQARRRWIERQLEGLF